MSSRAAGTAALVLAKLREWGWWLFVVCLMAALWFLFSLGTGR